MNKSLFNLSQLFCNNNWIFMKYSRFAKKKRLQKSEKNNFIYNFFPLGYREDFWNESAVYFEPLLWQKGENALFLCLFDFNSVWHSKSIILKLLIH
jgi:hypothetical protein